MSIFNRTGLSSEELSKFSAEAKCSKGELKKRVKMCLDAGLSLDYIKDNQLYMLPKAQLKAITSKKAIKTYIDVVVDRDGINVYEAFKQMSRAKDEFGISYSNFVSNNLTNADDDALRSIQKKREKKRNSFVKRIANIMEISEEEAGERLDHITSTFGYTPSGAYYRQLYMLTDDEIRERKINDRNARRQVIKKVMDETGWDEEKVKKHISHCNTVLGVDPDIYYACKCYKLSPEDLKLCGNMRDSRKIAAKYNKGGARILSDKARFNETYKKHIGRKFWVNRESTFEEFKDFTDGLTTLFCKPVDLSLGTGTSKIELDGVDLKELYDQLMGQPRMLVEECLTQHPEMAKFHPSTLNTVRLFTILDNGKFDAFASFVRFGIKGVTDNFSAGGIGCEVDPKTGIILTDGVTKDGTVFKTHPVSGFPFKGFQIPHWDKVLARSDAAIREVDNINYVGWDLAIRDDDVVFVEGNATPDLGVHQAIVLLRGEFIRPIYAKYIPKDDE